eukprot:698603-Alexandrium_andersonii.AAC.1
MSASLVGSEMCIRDSHSSGASGTSLQVASEPVQFKFRSPHARSAISRFVRVVEYLPILLVDQLPP